MKRKIGIIIIGIIIVVVIIIAIILSKKDKNIIQNTPVSHKVVEKLYEDHSNNKCTEVIKITSKVDVSEANDKVLLYLIFGQMKKDNIISSNISLDDYKTSALKILDEKDIPLDFEYVFEGYKYNLKDNKITREKSSCKENYVTKLYGYSGTEKLEVDVMAGYVKEGKVYDLKDNEIGTYNEEDINSILDKGTMQVYNYEKINDNYKLVSIGVK